MTPRSPSTDFPAAIAALVPDIRQVVTGALLRQGADLALAEDLIQDVVITLLGCASTYRPELGELRPWVQGVAMNVVKDCS
ncbi:sigma factor [Polyangium sp. y55x31]|uniref:RNA polymerase sigma factor n=1 Tax=Polyangium sp. y55x31 TaxID=3042688 RepID=UPI00248312D5|nr:sigma factor [Polyangium sp. y55x31]MDI1478594.1 sigma factor [Polyangium sp. y55x31]